jgi:hypothetical protein
VLGCVSTAASKRNIALTVIDATLEHYARQQRARTVGADLRDWELLLVSRLSDRAERCAMPLLSVQ